MLADVTGGLSTWWAPGLAFVAGIVSFASPCVFPLVPGYVSFITGETAGGIGERGRRPLSPMLLFVAGFTVVFTLRGAVSSTFVQIFRSTAVQWIGGLFVVAIGLLMVGYGLGVGTAGMYADRRPLLERARPGRWGAFPLGVAFAAGWTPCIGPVLGGILAIAGSQSTARGALLLICYSLGIGVPFVAIGLGVQWLSGAFAWVRRNYRTIAVVSGALLVVVGVLLVTGLYTRWMTQLSQYAPGL
jgi:cytochrome c-type biogenesis protein